MKCLNEQVQVHKKKGQLVHFWKYDCTGECTGEWEVTILHSEHEWQLQFSGASCQSWAEGLVFLHHGLDSSSRRPHSGPGRPTRLKHISAQMLKCGRIVFFRRTRVQTECSIKWCSRASWQRTHLSAASVDALELLPGATITGKLWLSGRKCTRKEQEDALREK